MALNPSEIQGIHEDAENAQQLTKRCPFCGEDVLVVAIKCKHCESMLQVPDDSIPDGVKGWSWGAFLLNWIWAIFNRTWWGLLALVPFVGFVVAIWLGVQGRELAWKNNSWDSVEHFNRVQKGWSQWGVALLISAAVIGIVTTIMIPAYSRYQQRDEAVLTTPIRDKDWGIYKCVDSSGHIEYYNEPHLGCNKLDLTPKGIL